MALDTSRLELLAGPEAMERLRGSAFLVCGLGGVGSWAAEALCRCGVGTLGIADFDQIHPSNLNRQLPALHSTLGQTKCEAMARRLRDIHPRLTLDVHPRKLTPETLPALLESRPWTGVLDAIDDRETKIALLEECVRRNIPVVSSLGAANCTRPEDMTLTTLEHTSGSPLARLVRKALRRRGVSTQIPCVATRELPILCQSTPETPGERRPMGSLVTVTATAGFLCADALLRPLLKWEERPRRGFHPENTP
ncbi:MAG: ThiF family adenylyltransferase [Oligosphaeraceae bacterium]